MILPASFALSGIAVPASLLLLFSPSPSPLPPLREVGRGGGEVEGEGGPLRPHDDLRGAQQGGDQAVGTWFAFTFTFEEQRKNATAPSDVRSDSGNGLSKCL